MTDSRIRWQCRRGMRELDELLLGWFESSYGDSSEAHKAAFRGLLSLPDPDLVGYLLQGGDAPDADTADVIRQIRGRT